jgi:N-methylhydantoinase B
VSAIAAPDAVDPIEREVVRSRLDSIADEMEATLLRAAYSPIVKEGLDASAALFDARGRNLAQAAAIPIHLGCLIPAVEAVLAAWPVDGMHEGDVFILNDPYAGGSHLPDIILVSPVFGDGRVRALAASMCHHQEIGGMVAGSLPPTATELFQEGLRIPPMRLVERGRAVPAIETLLRANVRIPDIVMGDLRAQLAACRVAERRLSELLAELEGDRFERIADDLLARSEAMTRARIEEVPDGIYRFHDFLDDDGVTGERLRIEIALTVAGSEVALDFGGTSAQARGPYNCVYSSTLAAVLYAVRAVCGADIPTNAGCYRPVAMTLPPGSLVNPRFPAPVNSRTATIKRISDVVLGCFAQAIPDRIPAASCGQLLVMNFGGIDPETGQAFVTSELGAGGMGARPGKDGVDCIETDATNCMGIPVEAIEMESPIRIHRWRIWDDSGGAGRWRGGCGSEKVFELLRGEVTATYRGERHTTRPWGLAGGRASRTSGAAITRADGRVEVAPSKATLMLRAGDRLEVRIGGGGGYGDPLERPPAAVAADVSDGLVGAERAASEYGVVLRDDGTADDDASARRREQLRAGRGPAPKLDRGEEAG